MTCGVIKPCFLGLFFIKTAGLLPKYTTKSEWPAFFFKLSNHPFRDARYAAHFSLSLRHRSFLHPIVLLAFLAIPFTRTTLFTFAILAQSAYACCCALCVLYALAHVLDLYNIEFEKGAEGMDERGCTKSFLPKCRKYITIHLHYWMLLSSVASEKHLDWKSVASK